MKVKKQKVQKWYNGIILMIMKIDWKWLILKIK